MVEKRKGKDKLVWLVGVRGCRWLRASACAFQGVVTQPEGMRALTHQAKAQRAKQSREHYVDQCPLILPLNSCHGRIPRKRLVAGPASGPEQLRQGPSLRWAPECLQVGRRSEVVACRLVVALN